MLTFLAAPAPVRAQVDLNDRQIDPVLNSAGKITVLVFVRTDCPISNRYAPVIKRLSSEYAEKAAFWLVYPNQRESAALIQHHLQAYGYKLPAVRDPQHVLVKHGQVRITPEAAVFDAKGHLVYHGRIDNRYQDVGSARSAPTTHELEDAIRATLAGRPLAIAGTSGVGCYIADLE